jgi:hypothetical protein
VESWREANDRVRRVGGWRAYAREIQTGESAADEARAATKPTAPAADPHAGHHNGAKP